MKAWLANLIDTSESRQRVMLAMRNFVVVGGALVSAIMILDMILR
jgi:hypothetical protein